MRISDWSSDVCSSDLRIDLSPSLEAFTELTYTKRSVPAFQVPLSGEFGLYGYDLSYVPATNPFNPFGVDVGVSYTFRNTGIFTKYSQDHYRGLVGLRGAFNRRSEEHTSELQSLMRISYAVFCLKKKKNNNNNTKS